MSILKQIGKTEEELHYGKISSPIMPVMSSEEYVFDFFKAEKTENNILFNFSKYEKSNADIETLVEFIEELSNLKVTIDSAYEDYDDFREKTNMIHGIFRALNNSENIIPQLKGIKNNTNIIVDDFI